VSHSYWQGGLGLVGACSRRGIGEALTLLDSRAASEEGSCMNPVRLLPAPHALVPDSQTACVTTQ
jgi:hypothetical protein